MGGFTEVRFKLLYTKYPYVLDPLHQSDELSHLLPLQVVRALATADFRMYLQYYWFGDVTINSDVNYAIIIRKFSPDAVNGECSVRKSFAYFTHYVATVKILHR